MNLVDKIFYDPISKGLKFFTKSGVQTFGMRQRKVLSGDITTSTTVPDLGFDNLVVGKSYRFTFAGEGVCTAGDAIQSVNIVHDSANLARMVAGNGSGSNVSCPYNSSGIFKATTTSLSVTTSSFGGSGSLLAGAYLILEEV
jgi:hypothetical protein